MTFAHPFWFIALALLPLLAIFYFLAEKKSAARLDQLVAPKLRETLLRGIHRGKRLLRFALMLLAFAALIAALAQPQLGFENLEIKRKGRDVVVAIDTSRSMLADDVSPNRLARTKLAVQDLLRILQGDRVALVAFAGTAFLQAPLTIDYQAVQDSLEQIDTNIIPKGGTNLAEAIKVGVQAFGKAEGANRALVVFTDGEELEADALKAAALAKEAGVRIFTVGVGSSEGALIPIQEEKQSSFVRDDTGQFVKTKLDETRLKEIAAAADGFYVHLENGSNAVQMLLDNGIRKLEEREGGQMLSRRPIERYQWPLGLAIVLFILAHSLGERRRISTALAAVALSLFSVRSSQAELSLLVFEKEKRAYNQGYSEYEAKKFDQALSRFSDASTSSDPEVRKKAEYNAANTLFSIGAKEIEKNRTEAIKKWKDALTHYDEALKVDPKFTDAKENRDAVEKLLKEDEKKKQEQDKRDQEDKKKNDEQDQKQDQQKSGDKPQDQAKNDQKSKEQKDSGQQKPESGKDGKNQPAKPPQSGKDQQPPRDEKNGGEKPEPAPTPGEKKEGELKAADAGEKKEEPKEGEAAGAEKPEEEKEGEMSKDQARQLIEAMQGEEQRVNLRDRMTEQPVAKDW